MESLDLAAALHNQVNHLNSCNFEGVLRILKFVNVNDIKSFIHGQIDAMDSDNLRRAYRSFPIDAVLPADVMQHVLSFGGYYEKIENRVICKQWNRLYKLNEEKMLRTVYQSVNDNYPEPLPQGNHTWILHDVRTILHPIEVRLGYRGPINKLSDVDTLCTSGDRVLVHNKVADDAPYGEKKSKDYYFHSLFETLEKDIHFIGVRSVEYGQSWISINSLVYAHLRFDNLKLRVHSRCDYDGRQPDVSRPGKLTMRNCEVISGGDVMGAIRVESNRSLDMEHCTYRFEKTECVHSLMRFFGCDAFWISARANEVNICNNTIIGFNKGIRIKHNMHLAQDHGLDLAEIRILNNVFEAIKTKAVMEITHRDQRSPRIKGSGRCILKGNSSSSESVEPNTLTEMLYAELNMN